MTTKGDTNMEGNLSGITEQDARIVINRKLQEAGWILEGPQRNVLTEQHSEAGFMDYLLLDRNVLNLLNMLL